MFYPYFHSSPILSKTSNLTSALAASCLRTVPSPHVEGVHCTQPRGVAGNTVEVVGLQCVHKNL
jgi:hypothetical protein